MSKNIQKISYFIIAFAMIAFSVTFNSCKKDPCSGKTCLNGGVCADGTCQCPAGVSGANCETKDLCYNISCKNGGSCVNGLCNCPAGYSGSDCSKQVTPTKIRITKIELTKFPATTAAGGGWDPSDAPDIFIKFIKGTSVIWESPTYFSNALQGNIYTFTPTNPIEITAPKDRYDIELWDYDTLDPNDFMSGIFFTPYSDTNGFPSVLTLECGACTSSYKVYFQYVF